MNEQFNDPFAGLFQAMGHSVPSTIARVLPCELRHDLAILPKRSTDHAAGLDLTAVSCAQLPGGVVEYDTGVAVAIPEGYVGLLFPRSSVSNHSLRLCNGVGVIDSDYRGTIKLRFDDLQIADSKPNYEIGDRIGQLVVIPAPRFSATQVNSLPGTDRGEGGFGHTGR